jgi:hypothetical protein
MAGTVPPRVRMTWRIMLMDDDDEMPLWSTAVFYSSVLELLTQRNSDATSL